MRSFLAIACILIASVKAVILPSQDPFYTTPANISNYELGEIIRSRPVSIITQTADFHIPAKSAVQYLVRSTDTLGNASAVVTTYLQPINATKPAKLVSYQVPYDSANNNCSPSYTLRAENQSSPDLALIAASLSQGWHVSVPDFEGLSAAYGSGLQDGVGTLDTVRAVASFLPATADPNIVLWGYSGGSVASEWASELAHSYAPELLPRIRGVALGGLVPNVTNLILVTNGTPNVGIAFSDLYSFIGAYPNMSAYYAEHLVPSKKAQFDEIGTQCTAQAVELASGLNIYGFFDTGSEFLYDAVPSSVLYWAGTMGLHGGWPWEVFAYKAQHDQFSPVADTDTLVAKMCSHGARVEYRRDSVGNHITEATTGGVEAFEWIVQLFKEAPDSIVGCTTTNVSLTGRYIAEAKDLPDDISAYLQKEFASTGEPY